MIPFMEFLLPFGERRPTSIERPEEIEALAREVIAAGGRFEAEMLRNGLISFEVVTGDPNGDVETLSVAIVANGPPALEAVDRLVREAHAALPRRGVQ